MIFASHLAANPFRLAEVLAIRTHCRFGELTAVSLAFNRFELIALHDAGRVRIAAVIQRNQRDGFAVLRLQLRTLQGQKRAHLLLITQRIEAGIGVLDVGEQGLVVAAAFRAVQASQSVFAQLRVVCRKRRLFQIQMDVARNPFLQVTHVAHWLGFVGLIVLLVRLPIEGILRLVTSSEGVRLNLRREAADFERVRECDEFFAQIGAGFFNQIIQSQAPRHVARILRHALGDGAQVEVQFVFHSQIAVGLIKRVNLFALQVLGQIGAQGLRFIEGANVGRNLRESSFLRRAQASFACNDLIARVPVCAGQLAHQDRLQDTMLFDAGDQAFELGGVNLFAGVVGGQFDLRERDGLLFAGQVYDGRLDLMSASAEDNTVAWFENKGGAGLSWALRVLTRAMDGARHIYAADLDGDGDMDIIAGAERNNTIAWYENKRGNPTTFVEHILSNTATGIHAIVAGDADHDGDMDVFAALESGERVMWYENNGARTPSFQEHTIATNFRIAHSISVSDLDSDGDLDVIATSRAGGQVAWFENVGGQYNVSQSAGQGTGGKSQVLLSLVFANRARQGDVPMRVNALTLRFATKTGRPLTPTEATSLFSGLAVHQDSNFNGIYDPGIDGQLTSIDSLNLDAAGQLLIDLPPDQPAVRLAPGGSVRYFVTGTTLNNRCFSSDTVQISHIANAMTVVNQQTGYRMASEYMRSIDALGSPQESTQTPVVINEIMADNTHTLEDPNEPEEYPDWIELYNPATVPVNLGGMFLSDDPANSQLYRIPDGLIIGANDYLVFIADGEPEQGPLHTNFRLSKGGESVTLIDKAERSYRLVDQIAYDGLAADVSYGRLPNASSTWKVLGAATPGSYNLDQPLIIQAHVYAPVIANGTACR